MYFTILFKYYFFIIFYNYFFIFLSLSLSLSAQPNNLTSHHHRYNKTQSHHTQ